MTAYSTLGANDMDRSIAFYDAVFGALGGVRAVTTRHLNSLQVYRMDRFDSRRQF